MPASRHFSLSPRMALAVMAMMRIELAVGAGADALGGFVAVEFGHLAIHEDEVVGPHVERGEDFEAVVGDVGACNRCC